MTRRVALLLGLVLTAACTGPRTRGSDTVRSSGSKPDWVAGASRSHPRDLYIAGVGMGDSRQAAEDRARGEIAKLFSSLVTVKTDFTESEGTRTGGAGSENSFSRSLSQNIQNVSQMAQEGVEIADNWQDSADRTYYALAVLERSKALSAVTERLTDLDGQTRDWKKRLDESTERLGQVQASMKLLALFKTRDVLANQYRVLDAEGKSPANPLNTAEIKGRASRAVAALIVLIDLSCTSDDNSLCGDEVETGVIAGLNELGMQAKAGTQVMPSDILITAELFTQPITGDVQWKWARSTVTVSLKDGRTGKIFVRFDAAERQASADLKEAARRSRASLSKKISRQTHDAIVGYFENQ